MEINNWNEADDESLVTIIQENPTIWDTSRYDFRDSKKKQRIFIQIALHFPGINAVQIEKRFVALKEKLRREKRKEDARTRSEAGASTSRSWYLLPKLDFLRRTMNTRQTTSLDPRQRTSEDSSSMYVSSLAETENDIDDPSSPNSSSPTPTPTHFHPATNLFENSVIENEFIRCPTSINTPKSANKLREALYEESREAIKKIGESASQVVEQTQLREQGDKKRNHFKIFQYIAEEIVDMDPDLKSQFIKKMLDLYWEFKLK